MKILITAFAILLLTGQAWAQKNEDSLQYYDSKVADTTTLNHLIDYCFNHIGESPDLAYAYSEKALAKSKVMGSKPCEARSITNLGAVEATRGNYAAALNDYLQSLAIWEALNIPRGVLLSKNNIASVYGFLKKPDLQFQFLKEAESIARQYSINDELGLIKTNLSVYYSNKGNFREAFNEQLAAVNINLQLNKTALASLGYSNAGGYLFFLNKIDSAIIFYQQAKLLAEKDDDKKTIAMSWANLAEAFEAKKQTDSAIEYYGNAIAIARANTLKEILSFSYDQLATIYKNKGDYNKALGFTELKQAVKDSILNATVTKQLAEMQTKYETEKKERTIVEKEFEITKRNYWITGILITGLLTTLLLYAFNRRQQSKKEAAMQAALRAREAQAAKAVIEAEENERRRIATDLHDGVGQTMSAAKMNLSAIGDEIEFINAEQKTQFEKAINLVDESCREVRNVSHNMMPNALLKAGLAGAVRTFLDNLDKQSLKVNLYIDGFAEKLDNNIETVLYRVIQEAVNNVIKHAAANQLDISLIREMDMISVTIEDNGKGFDRSMVQNGDGIGLKNIQSRITFLKGTVEWDAAVGRGTAVVINIPCVKAIAN